MVQRATAEGYSVCLSVCPSVCPSVRHTRDPRLNGSRYGDMFRTVQ